LPLAEPTRCRRSWSHRGSRHLLGRLALDAHGDAEGADLEVGDRAIEDLAEQVRAPAGAVERPRALLAAADFLDVLADAHGGLSQRA
jgi:hypothetical protein